MNYYFKYFSQTVQLIIFSQFYVFVVVVDKDGTVKQQKYSRWDIEGRGRWEEMRLKIFQLILGSNRI